VKFFTNLLSEITVICINLATQEFLCGNSSLKDKWLLCCNRWSLWKIQIQTPRRHTWTSRCWWCSLYSLTVLIKESLINDHQLICLLRVQSECGWFDRMNICHNLFSLMFWPGRESNPGPWAWDEASFWTLFFFYLSWIFGKQGSKVSCYYWGSNPQTLSTQ